MPCPRFHCLLLQLAQKALEGHFLPRFEDGDVGGPLTLELLPLRDGIFLLRYFLRTVSLSVPFFVVVNIFLGHWFSKAYPLKIFLA